MAKLPLERMAPRDPDSPIYAGRASTAASIWTRSRLPCKPAGDAGAPIRSGDDGWPQLQEWIAASVRPVEFLPGTDPAVVGHDSTIIAGMEVSGQTRSRDGYRWIIDRDIRRVCRGSRDRVRHHEHEEVPGLVHLCRRGGEADSRLGHGVRCAARPSTRPAVGGFGSFR